jgi:hypothetical protein
MNLQKPCQTCSDLWREYAEATRAHVELVNEQQRLSRRDTARWREIEPLVELAAVRRDSVRVGIRVHLATEHEQAPAARTTSA